MLQSSQLNNRRGKSAFDRGSDLLATVLGAVLTFFAGPPLYSRTVSFATDYAAREIGTGWDWLVIAFWVLACGVGTFGLCSMMLALTLRVVFAKLASLIFRI